MTAALIYLSRVLAPRAVPGSQISDARDSLDYWSRHASQLPWHRRAARHEARTAISAARARLIAADLEGRGFGSIAPHLTPLLDTRGRGASAHVRSLALTGIRRTAIGRRLLVAAAAVTVGCVCIAVLAVAAAAHAIALF